MAPPKTFPPLRPSDIVFGLAFLGVIALFAWIIIRTLLSAA
jgi:hypothetical protein